MKPVRPRDVETPEQRSGGDLHSSVISEGRGPDQVSYEAFELVDWAAAAPSWASIVGGVVFPIVAVAGLIILIDVVLCWASEQWIGHFRTVPIWLLATMVFPVALVGAITLAKIFLQISGVDWLMTRSKEVSLTKQN